MGIVIRDPAKPQEQPTQAAVPQEPNTSEQAERERREAIERQHLRQVTRGEIVFDQGDEGRTMFFIQSGRIQISVVRGKTVQPIAILTSGDFFGEMALLHDAPRIARAQALTDCTLIELDREAFDDFLTSNNRAAISIIKVLTRRLRQTDELVTSMLAGDPQSKVAEALLKLTAGVQRGNNGFEVPQDVNELMVSSGTDAEVLKMILARFKSGGFLNIVEGKLYVSNRERLQQYSNFISIKGG